LDCTRLGFAIWGSGIGDRYHVPLSTREHDHPWFRQLLILNDASSGGLLALVFPTLTLPRVTPGTLTRRSPPRLFTAAARAGLRPAPESRSRGAYPHLLCSFTTRIHRISDSLRASAAHIMSPNCRPPNCPQGCSPPCRRIAQVLCGNIAALRANGRLAFCRPEQGDCSNKRRPGRPKCVSERSPVPPIEDDQYRVDRNSVGRHQNG
jgi:hypothetical protein